MATCMLNHSELNMTRTKSGYDPAYSGDIRRDP